MCIRDRGYTVLIARDGVTFIVTNTYAPDKPMTRMVVKVWDDKGYDCLLYTSRRAPQFSKR